MKQASALVIITSLLVISIFSITGVESNFLGWIVGILGGIFGMAVFLSGNEEHGKQ